MDTSTYEDKLNECISKIIRIRSDNTGQLKEVLKQWKTQKAIISADPIIDNYFSIEDLKEWLYAVAQNNEEQCDCILNIVDRLPGFVQYVKDKKAGII